jgi:hypothetical protein
MGIPKLPVALLLLGALALAAGCNEDSDSSAALEDYFQHVEALSADVDSRFNEFEDALGSLTDESSTDEVSDIFEEARQILQDLSDGLREVDPPQEAEDAHGESLAAVDGASVALDGYLVELDAITSLDVAYAVFQTTVAPEFRKTSAACRELQRIADDNSIEVDLMCEDEQIESSRRAVRS